MTPHDGGVRTEREPPTISDLVEDLEAIREEHGDLPVVYIEEMWHVFPTPSVEDGLSEHAPETNVEERRVEL